MNRLYITLVCFFISVLMFNGCKQTPDIKPDDASIIKDWYEKQHLSYKLQWSNSRAQQLSDGKKAIIVPLDHGVKTGPDMALSQSVLFTIQSNDVLDARRIDVLADISTIELEEEKILSFFLNNNGSYATGNNKIHIILHDLSYNYLGSKSLVDGVFVQSNIQVLSRKFNVKNTLEKLATKKGSSRPPSLANVPVECADWYGVTTYDDGSQEWQYLYTICTGGGSDGGGGGGGGGSGGTGTTSYLFLSPAEPLNLEQSLNCFNSVPSNSATQYKVTIHTHLANPDNPTQVYNFQENDPGHAYITLEKTNGSDIRSLTFGFYPSQDTWITGTKNAVGSSIGKESPETRNSDARYTINVSESAFSSVVSQAISSSNKPYDLNGYNCTDYAVEVFNTALSAENRLNVADNPIGYTTPAGLYGKLNEMKQSGTQGVSTTQIGAPISSQNCN